jgi:colicin import membrane protein
MADPTGTVGAPHTGRDSDMALAVTGGPRFMARLQQLADEAGRLEQAAAKMRIGDNVEVALQRAEAELTDAEAQNRKAQKALAAAQEKAKAIVAQANTEASAVVEAALAATAKAEAEADKTRQDAGAFAAKMKADADAVVRAREAQRAAEARGRETDGKLARLNAELRAIRREWESRA